MGLRMILMCNKPRVSTAGGVSIRGEPRTISSWKGMFVKTQTQHETSENYPLLCLDYGCLRALLLVRCQPGVQACCCLRKAAIMNNDQHLLKQGPTSLYKELRRPDSQCKYEWSTVVGFFWAPFNAFRHLKDENSRYYVRDASNPIRHFSWQIE